MSADGPTLTRRALLAGAAGAMAGALVRDAAAQETSSAPAVPVDATKVPGAPTRGVGQRSPFEQPHRTPTGEQVGNSLTPLQDLVGTITPSDLHFERHHAGVPAIDPRRHRLMIHGMVRRPLLLTLDDLKRYPAVSRMHFIECSGNGRKAYRTPAADMTPQLVDGMTANSEWTGVPLATLLEAVGAKRGAGWFLAEGGDACRLTRSIPVDLVANDALVVYAQNGEAIRPEQGYPLRLLLPGIEGNACVKWLRRLKLVAGPEMTRWETAKYTDPLPNDTARQFSFTLDAKSIITTPAAPARLGGAGWWPIRGLAWSGRGRITRVDVSTDGGRSWTPAELIGPLRPKAHVRFQTMWRWDGRETVLCSRAVDETGYVQPTYAELVRVRGKGTDFHFNDIRGWRVLADGQVRFDLAGRTA